MRGDVRSSSVYRSVQRIISIFQEGSMKSDTSIGFIGFGNMAQAIASGLLRAGAVKPGQLCACARNYEKLSEKALSLHIRACKTAEEVIRCSDFVVLAVKPYQMEALLAPLTGLLAEKALISIAAGYCFDKYQSLLQEGTRHISTIPNTPVAVCEGILICEEKHSLSKEEYEIFRRIFSSVAMIETVDTKHLSIAGTLSGCSPAFTAMYLEALSDAGVKHGLTRESSFRLAAKMLCGTGRLYLEEKKHPGAMKDAVCSPGGTTIRGVASLEKNGFRGAVIEAIDAIENS